MKTTIAVVAGALLLSGAAFAAETKAAPAESGTWAEGTGEADITNVVTETMATERATQVAMRSCVEAVTGTYVSSFSETKNFEMMQDIVATNTVGYVRKHEVKTKDVDPEKSVKVTLKCLVDKAELDKDAAAVATILNLKKQRRVYVLIDEQLTDTVGTKTTQDNMVIHHDAFAAAFGGALNDDGFTVLDPNSSGGKLKVKATTTHVKNPQEASELANSVGADLVIYGNVLLNASEAEIYGTKGFAGSLTMNLTAMSPGSTQIITKYSKVIQCSGLTMTQIRQTCLKTATEDAVPAIRRPIYAAWRKHVTDEQRISVTITGVKDLGALNLIKQMLSSQVRGVKSLASAKLAKGVASVEVSYQGTNPEALASDLTGKSISRVGTLSVTAYNDSAIEISVEK